MLSTPPPPPPPQKKHTKKEEKMSSVHTFWVYSLPLPPFHKRNLTKLLSIDGNGEKVKKAESGDPGTAEAPGGGHRAKPPRADGLFSF